SWSGHYKTFMPEKPRLGVQPSPSTMKAHPKYFSSDDGNPFRTTARAVARWHAPGVSSGVLIRAGTRMRIEQFDLERNPENDPMVWIRGYIFDGPLAGNRLNVSLISREAGDSPLNVGLLMVDPNYL